MDINECTEVAPCKLGQTCRNLLGSYICICYHGYKLDPATGLCSSVKTAVYFDIDTIAMCLVATNSGKRHIYIHGLFPCRNKCTYSKVGRTMGTTVGNLQIFLYFCRLGDCVDINECAKGYCGSGEKCINTEGSFRCLCSPGMTKVTNITLTTKHNIPTDCCADWKILSRHQRVHSATVRLKPVLH